MRKPLITDRQAAGNREGDLAENVEGRGIGQCMEKGDQIVYFVGTQFERHDFDAIRDGLNRLIILHARPIRNIQSRHRREDGLTTIVLPETALRLKVMHHHILETSVRPGMPPRPCESNVSQSRSAELVTIARLTRHTFAPEILVTIDAISLAGTELRHANGVKTLIGQQLAGMAIRTLRLTIKKLHTPQL